MAGKEFKTISEQIAILQKRGLCIEDVAQAEKFLLNNNYYRISGYTLTLRKNDAFSPGASLSGVMEIYNCDHAIRHSLLKYIDKIETRFKSLYAYEFTKRHDPAAYLKPGIFTNAKIHDEVIQRATQQLHSRLPHEAYLKHFVNDLHQDLPLWAFVDLLTIANISFLYSITDEEVKKAVAAHFNLRMNRSGVILSSFMHSMTIVRNLCAHGSRLYNRLFEQKPSLNKREKALLRVDKTGELDNAHLYGFVLLMKRLLLLEDFAAFKDELISIADTYPYVYMKHYGFREDWRTVL